MADPRKSKLPLSELHRLWYELVATDAKLERLLRVAGYTPETWAKIRAYERNRVRTYEHHLDPHEKPASSDVAWLRGELNALTGA